MSPANFTIQVCGWVIGLPLQVLLLAALLRGAYKLLPFLFIYATANFVTTLVEIPAYVAAFYTQDKLVYRHFALIYWVNESILQVLVFALVISLIDRATVNMRSRQVVRTGIICGAVLFVGISLAIYYQPPPVKYGIWMTPWTSAMSFGAAILDVMLWAILIGSRRADRRLLLISGALGMQFTGEAIGEAIRNLSVAKMVQSVSLTGSVVAMLADLACLYVWWRTFRRRREA